MKSTFFFNVSTPLLKPPILFPFELKNATTGYVESLPSYFCRLARAHNISPTDLIRRVVLPAARDRPAWLQCPKKIVGRHMWRAMLGPGQAAAIFSETATQLTGQDDLVGATLVPMGGVIAPYQCVTNTFRYCARCYLESINTGGEPFDQLLWCLQVVRACPIHGTKLREKICGELQGRKRVNIYSRCLLPGFCSICGAFSYECSKLTEKKASRNDIGIAVQAAELLSLTASGSVLEKSTLSAGIKHIIDDQFGGSGAALASHCRIHKSQVWDWLHASRKMALSSLLQVSSGLNVSMVSLLIGNPTPVTKKIRYKAMRLSSNRLSKDEIRAMLKIELKKEEGAASLNAFTERVGMRSPHTLRKHFPGLCQNLVALSKRHREKVRQQTLSSAKAECEHLLTLLYEQGVSATLRNVAKITGKRWSQHSTKGRIFLELRAGASERVCEK